MLPDYQTELHYVSFHYYLKVVGLVIDDSWFGSREGIMFLYYEK